MIVNTQTKIGTVKQHRKALVDLWRWQQTQFPERMASVMHPKTSANWASILENFGKQTAERRRKAYGPRGAALLQQGYNEEQHKELCDYGLVCSAKKPTGKFSQDVAVRFHWMHTWGHAMCLRHDDRTALQLPDIFVLPVSHQGPKETPLLVAVMDQGKTNHNGRVDIAAAMRHWDSPLEYSHFAWIMPNQSSSSCG